MGLFDRILNKMALMPTKELEEKAYTGLSAYVRDTNMEESFGDKYFKGLILREPGVTEASRRIGGMVTSHRYVILSNHMEKHTEPENDGLGLVTAPPDARFKVLGRCTHEGKTAIVLLHLPDEKEFWSKFWGATFPHDKKLFARASEHFMQKEVAAEPVTALCSEVWLARCAVPLGMDENGKPHPVEDKKKTNGADEAVSAEETTPAPDTETAPVPAEDTAETAAQDEA